MRKTKKNMEREVELRGKKPKKIGKNKMNEKIKNF